MNSKLNELIDDLVDEALKNSTTYNAALQYVESHCPWSDLGVATKKAAQDMIRARALNSQIS